MNPRRWMLLTGAAVPVIAAAVFLSTSSGRASPHVATPTSLSSPVDAWGDNIQLAPPPQGYSPEVSAASADAAAEGEFTGRISSVSPQLVSFSWDAVHVDANDNPTGPPLYTNVPAWVVKVDGPCSAVAPSSGQCTSTVSDVVVDARTGQVIITYSG